MHDLMLADSFTIALWLDCTLVWEMIDMARVRVWESCEFTSASSIASCCHHCLSRGCMYLCDQSP